MHMGMSYLENKFIFGLHTGAIVTTNSEQYNGWSVENWRYAARREAGPSCLALR